MLQFMSTKIQKISKVSLVSLFFPQKVPLSSLSIRELQNLITRLKKASNGELNTKYKMF